MTDFTVYVSIFLVSGKSEGKEAIRNPNSAIYLVPLFANRVSHVNSTQGSPNIQSGALSREPNRSVTNLQLVYNFFKNIKL